MARAPKMYINIIQNNIIVKKVVPSNRNANKIENLLAKVARRLPKCSPKSIFSRSFLEVDFRRSEVTFPAARRDPLKNTE